MREIKFRAWDPFNAVMIYSKILSNFFNTFEKAVNGENNPVLMQFTGLLDKNGKEGYHKDLIVNLSRNNGKPHILEWSRKFGAWVGKYGELEYILAQEIYECDFVGNIYEDPELL